MMKRWIPFLLALLMLLQCGCAVGNSACEKEEDFAMSRDVIENNELEPIASKSSATRIFYTTEYAYVRGGSEWANKNWHKMIKMTL